LVPEITVRESGASFDRCDARRGRVLFGNRTSGGVIDLSCGPGKLAARYNDQQL
jgi:hypothetical protein